MNQIQIVKMIIKIKIVNQQKRQIQRIIKPNQLNKMMKV